MAGQLNGIGLHVLYDGIDSEGNLWSFLDKLKPAVINVVGAARRDQAWGFARSALARYPGMRVIFRIWPDDGNWCKSEYSDPGAWLRMAAPFLSSGLTVLADNESITEDLTRYSEWHAALMDAAGIQGWKLAVGRFATGNPRENQYGQLKALFRSLSRWGNLHVFSPNEYQSQRHLPGSTPGHTRRLDHALSAIQAMGFRRPQISIGEWALVYQHAGGWMDPGSSWQDIPFYPGHQYAKDLVENYRAFYQPLGISTAIYAWGDSIGQDWKKFRVDRDVEFQNTLVESASAGRLLLPGSSPPPPVVSPPPASGSRRRVVLPRGNTFVNLRTSPSTASNVRIVGRLKAGEIVDIVGDQIDLAGILWYQTTRGWVSTQGVPGKPRIRFVAV